MKKVLIVGGGFQYATMFEAAGYAITDNIDEADLVQFTGGSDVHPHLYGEQRHPQTHFNVQRDTEETWLYKRCVALKLPMVGICRGGQFLNVMNGGRLWQHVDNHAIASTHLMYCELTHASLQVSSTHHQMMMPNTETGTVIGTGYEASFKECWPLASREIKRIVNPPEDVEVVHYEETRTLCYQPHPEIMSKESDCRHHFFTCIELLLGVKA